MISIVSTYENGLSPTIGFITEVLVVVLWVVDGIFMGWEGIEDVFVLSGDGFLFCSNASTLDLDTLAKKYPNKRTNTKNIAIALSIRRMS